jgi:large subunit ribosomal protein L13
MILDATDLIVGRFATVVAKKALLGETVDIVNCEHAILTGNKREIIERYKRKRRMGVPLQGPYFPKLPDRLVRRVIRGMLPYKKPKGKDAFQRVMCHIGVPEKFNGKLTTLEGANVKKLPNVKYLEVGKICKEIGAKV